MQRRINMHFPILFLEPSFGSLSGQIVVEKRNTGVVIPSIILIYLYHSYFIYFLLRLTLYMLKFSTQIDGYESNRHLSKKMFSKNISL